MMKIPIFLSLMVMSAAVRAQSTQPNATSSWRHIQQVLLQDAGNAAVIAARVRRGDSLEAAAKESGLTHRDMDMGDTTQTLFAEMNTEVLARLVFSAPSGSVVGPVKTEYGWHVIVPFAPAPPARVPTTSGPLISGDWQFLARDSIQDTYIDRTSIRQSQGKHTAFTYAMPHLGNDWRIRQWKFDCRARTVHVAMRLFAVEHGLEIYEDGKVSPHYVPKPGTTQEKLLNTVCQARARR